MAVSVKFEGVNRQFITPLVDRAADLMNGHDDIHGYTNGVWTWSRWKLSPAELKQVAETGEIWLCQRVGKRGMVPTFLGSWSWMAQHALDFGRTFRKKPRPVRLIEDKRVRRDNPLR